MIDSQFIKSVHTENIRNAKRTLWNNVFSIALSIYIALVVIALTSITSEPPAVEAFATDHAGHETNLSPVINPNVTEEQAVRWVTGAVIDLMSIRFATFDRQIRLREPYFYGDGYQRYRENLYSNVVPIVRDELLIVTAINVGKPKRVRMQRIGDVIQRTYQVKVLQTTQGPTSERKTEKRVVVITVVETTRDESITGLQIKRFFVTG